MDAGAGRRLDPRLSRFKATQGSDEQQAGQDPYGGYVVPVAIAPGVLTLQPEDDPITPLTTNVPMTAPSVKINARVDKNHATSVSGGLTVARRPETVDGSSSRMAFEQVTLEAHELFGMTYATETILTDSPQSFIAILAAGFRDEFASRAIEEYLNGTGTGEFLGVMKSHA
ncbi:MAG: phage major capsid protein [Bryobacterales bacterium]|nr:phage major capsid protein [Bryobacterales bacterium]